MRKERKHQYGHEDVDKFILLALLKGELSFADLQDKFLQLTSQFALSHKAFEEWAERKGEQVHSFLARLGHEVEKKDRHLKRQEQWKPDDIWDRDTDVRRECDKLIEKKLVRVTDANTYGLTEAGKAAATNYAHEIERSARIFREWVASPAAAARNTVVVDFFLALMKLTAGFLSGSVGLIADGADAAIDTVSASVVWLGIRYKKELVGTLIIILMMFVTAGSVGFESITKIAEAVTATLAPLTRPYLVIAVESFALIAAILLGLYQRLVGKRNGSLALISQSIDSKNHIYVAAAVIIGAVFSIFGIHYVDAVIGAYIAIRILKDGFELSGEALSSMKGEEPDLSKYRTPLEAHYERHKLESFRSWILYAIKEEHLKTKADLIRSLEKAFKPGYVPILSEFEFSLGAGFDFEAEFDELVSPLVANDWLRKENDTFALTEEGEKRIESVLGYMRFHRNK